MSTPPNSYITQQLWDFWTEFDAYDRAHILTDEIVLGGIYADKRGYHNTVLVNKRKWPGNYSYADHPNQDDVFPKDKARAIDLTFRDAQAGDYSTIIKYTRLLIDAGKRRDSRLYRNGRPILREVLGTTDGKITDQYDFNTNSRRYRPDSTHMWHIHLSVHTEFCDDAIALRQIMSILKEEPEMDFEVITHKAPILKYGMRNLSYIGRAQTLLNFVGYKLTVDGVYGKETRDAIKSVSARAKRAVDGNTIDEWTWKLLTNMW